MGFFAARKRHKHCSAQTWTGLRSWAPDPQRHTFFQMNSTEPHVELCNTLMAANRMWEVTIDTLPDAVYIFGPDKRLSKINRAGEALEQASRSFLAGRRCCD